jgi:hypothetical protein
VQIEIRIETSAGTREARIPIARMINLGSATRDPGTAEPHQHEVARSGIHIALSVPAPRLYPIGTHALTTGGQVEVHGAETSGEVEIVVLAADQVYVGVGSDHTDRACERHSILWSKQACPNVLAPVLWPLDEIAERWDSCTLRAWVDGRRYQDVSVAAFIRPEEMLRIVRERAPGLPPGNLLVFGGTIVSLDKRLGFGRRWEFELDDPTAGRRIRHGYDVVDLTEEIAPGYRVPILNPAPA